MTFPITRQKALENALHHIIRRIQSSNVDGWECYEDQPANCRIYNMPKEPCWFVYVPWGDGYDGCMLRSSRVILVSKQTGKILYDGSAGDEG
ncbi:MAG: hypothetical protein PHU03_06430 [Syntrophales bacterium]|nr:hypothetical protein [Syntrophales bacterium]